MTGPDRKAWVDRRALWLVHQFGLETILDATIALPTSACFPDRYAGTIDDGIALFGRVARYLRLEDEPLHVHFYNPQRRPDQFGALSEAAGYCRNQHGSVTIGLNESQLADPLALASTMAHELCHVLLLRRERIGADEDDHEPLTDLLMVFLGFGVFKANDASRHMPAATGWQTRPSKGYLGLPELAYALALHAFVRGEPKPRWDRHLRGNVRVPFWQNLRYLLATGDTPCARLRVAPR